MRRDRALLDDMIEAASSIGVIVAETNYHGLVRDEVRKAAILHHLAVIGEAVGRPPPPFAFRRKARLPTELRSAAIAFSERRDLVGSGNYRHLP